MPKRKKKPKLSRRIGFAIYSVIVSFSAFGVATKELFVKPKTTEVVEVDKKKGKKKSK